MKAMARGRRNGFTLIEITIVTVILSIVILTVYSILANSTVTFTNMTRLGDLQDRARQVTDAISKEMRAADIYSKFSLVANTSADSISFRVPKWVDPASGAIVWSDTDDSANPSRYAGSTYVPKPCLVCYRLNNSLVDADNNGTKDKRLERVLLDPVLMTDLAGTRTIFTDYLKATGGGVANVFTRAADNTVAVSLTFMVGDYRNKVLQRNILCSVSLRNNTAP